MFQVPSPLLVRAAANLEVGSEVLSLFKSVRKMRPQSFGQEESCQATDHRQRSHDDQRQDVAVASLENKLPDWEYDPD